MATTNNKKKQNASPRRKTNGNTAKNKKIQTKIKGNGKAVSQETVNSGLALEIMILVVMAVSILLMISNFGIGGKIGNALSNFLFGIMGICAYIFPIILFLGVSFGVVNRKNSRIKQKITGIVLGYWCLTACIHLLTMGYAEGEKIAAYYKYCSVHKTGGGLIGGSLAKVLCSGFGIVGAYVILVIAFLIAVVIMTQKSILKPIKNKSEQVYQEVKGNREKRRSEAAVFNIEQIKLPTDDKKLAVQEKKSKEEIAIENEQYLENDQDKVVSFPEIKIHRPEPEEIFPIFMEEELETELLEPEKEDGKERKHPKKEEPEQSGVNKKRNPKSSEKEIEDGIKNIQKEISEKEIPQEKQYEFPPVNLLNKGNGKTAGDSDEYIKETAMKLQNTLHNFGVNVTVTNVSCGPTVTRYELQPEQGVKVSKIVGLADDIKLNLAAADIRIEAPIPGKAAVGIEVPNATNSAVMLRDLLESKEFMEYPSELAFAVGKDIAGKTIVADIGKMPHLLIAGATGSGKSVCINTLIMSIIYKASPDDVKLIMIDPKVVELSVYNGIPHLFIPVVTEPKKAAGALNWAVAEMTDRYNKFAEYNVRDLKGYNEKVAQLDDINDENKPKRLPKIIIIVDELADLMMVAPGEVEDAICRLAQLARAAGIHLIIATQRPSVNVITGLIKANMPSRIAFAVSSGVDSRTILDMVGAEKLLGKGDMLYYPQGYPKPVRLQGSFVSDVEVGKVVEFLTDHHQKNAIYDEQIKDMMNSSMNVAAAGNNGDEKDVYFVDAGKFIIDKDKASIGMLQRVFKIGFNRAARIMDQLSEAGVVGPEEGTKPRKVLMSMEEFENYIEESL